MGPETNQVVPPFDFAEALSHDVDKRLELSVENVRRRLTAKGSWDLYDMPPVPPAGATEQELARLEASLGVPLPPEYRTFLTRWRYLIIGSGLQIWGFDHEGVGIGTPWVSDTHPGGGTYLVFGDCWNYADGDQLLFDLNDPARPVLLYLHEHGPSFEQYAPSFSLALWRMVEGD
jgi:hypothetical protein